MLCNSEGENQKGCKDCDRDEGLNLAHYRSKCDYKRLTRCHTMIITVRGFTVAQLRVNLIANLGSNFAPTCEVGLKVGLSASGSQYSLHNFVKSNFCAAVIIPTAKQSR